MPDQLARATAAIVAGLLVAVIGILVVTSRPPAGANEVVAEFDDAFPLIEGMYVRVDGAIAGSVGPIEVNDQGNAEVTLLLDESIEPPMGDARATIRQQDTTGDSYVAFEPNPEGSDRPLGPEGLRCEVTAAGETCPQTMVAPRLDDLLNAFGEPERAGVKLILNELATALEQRGESLHDAAFELRPALATANAALAEVNEQNTALKSLITSAENVTGQAADRNTELDRLIMGLEATVVTTAQHGTALNASLERLPATAASARTTLAALRRAAVEGRPLAEEVASGAPELATAIERLPAFLDDADATIDASTPTLELARRLLKAALPSLIVGKDRVITGVFDFTAAASDLINSVLGGTGDPDNDGAFPSLFDDDSYGVPGEGTLSRRGFGAVAVQPGDLPPYPAEHANRNFLRVSAILNCGIFGVPVEPGCLADVIAGGGLPFPFRTGARAQRSGDREPSRTGRPAGSSDRPGAAASPKPPGLKLPKIEDLLSPLLGGSGKGNGKAGEGKQGGGKGKKPPSEAALADLLDFLLGT